MMGCSYRRSRMHQFRDLPMFPFIPLVPLLMAGSVLGLLIANYLNGKKILDILDGMQNDLAQQSNQPESGQT